LPEARGESKGKKEPKGKDSNWRAKKEAVTRVGEGRGKRGTEETAQKKLELGYTNAPYVRYYAGKNLDGG